MPKRGLMDLSQLVGASEGITPFIEVGPSNLAPITRHESVSDQPEASGSAMAMESLV
jgi:hypothetical protein